MNFRPMVFFIIQLFFLWGMGAPLHATSVSHDFGDAPGPYGSASHGNGDIRLGLTWTGESAPQSPDSADDGLSWSTDGGATYHDDPVNAGDTIQFSVTAYRERSSDSYAFDHISIWADFNGNGIWEDGEQVLDESWNARGRFEVTQPIYIEVEGITIQVSEGGASAYVPPEGIRSFPSEARQVPGSLSQLHVRTRITSGPSLTAAGLSELGPTGHLNLGEVEDYAISIRPVPEPSALLLLGLGLLAGLARIRKQAVSKVRF